MITLIHGDDVVLSREYFLSEKQRHPNSAIYDGKSLEKTSLLEVLQPKNLFFEKQAVFIENLSFQKELFKELEKVKNPDIFLWEGKELSKADLGLLRNTKIRLFKLPQALFSFLDGIKPKNPHNVSLFRSALKNLSEDMVFYMLIRQFRLLLAISDSKDGIDEVKRLAPWQRSKLERQARMFDSEELKRIYKKLYEIDFNIKTGEINSITSSIDFLLLDI